ncbi:GET complex subunit get1 [Loxospora ochrophaea]|nr:GET complex subunit get1 [Loxospora ochrophaea]
MPSLLLIVFALQLLIHLLNTVGAASINNLLWVLYNKLPTATSENVRSQTILRGEVVRLKREMNSTSSQDEFAKWAKLRRQHDKVVAEYEDKSQKLQSSRASFDSAAGMLRWLGTNGLRFFLQFWCTKQPLFWLPKGWLPWYGEWILSFPRAPMGSVSIQIWFGAAATVILLVGQALTASRALLADKRLGQGAEKTKEGVKMGGRGNSEGEKKDL